MRNYLIDRDAVALRESLITKRRLPLDVVKDYVQNVVKNEDKLHVFASFDAEQVSRDAQSLNEIKTGLPLFGLPIGVKDVFDTKDYPTEFFSPIYRGNQPTTNAAAVALLLEAGAVIMGKTHTAEFAYMHTGPTRNPLDRRRTPGSSSAGSAAGVSAGFFPLALGTQTAGSILKPASYCGIFGFKPTYGKVSLVGVRPLAPTFDTVGWFGRSVRDIKLLADLLVDQQPRATTESKKFRIGVCRTCKWYSADPGVRDEFERAVTRLHSAGFHIGNVTLPDAADQAYRAHETINDAEGARSMKREAETCLTSLSGEMRSLLGRAASLPPTAERHARRILSELRPYILDAISQFDVIMSLTCSTIAPIGLKKTGPSDFIKFWTAFGLPQLSIPIREPISNLPIGLQLIGNFGEDAQLLESAEHIAAVVESRCN